jgi:hypothetical protein
MVPAGDPTAAEIERAIDETMRMNFILGNTGNNQEITALASKEGSEVFLGGKGGVP